MLIAVYKGHIEAVQFMANSGILFLIPILIALSNRLWTSPSGNINLRYCSSYLTLEPIHQIGSQVLIASMKRAITAGEYTPDLEKIAKKHTGWFWKFLATYHPLTLIDHLTKWLNHAPFDIECNEDFGTIRRWSINRTQKDAGWAK